MKAANSRQSHRPSERYANVGHLQGAMVTDADLSESGQLHQARDEAQSRAFAGSGVPSEGGMIASMDPPLLQDGTVFAQGRQGHFRLSAEANSLTAAMDSQTDFPEAPGLPEAEAHLVYVDVWDRAVRAFEDEYLADAGLHGVETSYRTRTMAQVKAVALDESVAKTMEGPAFQRTGGATAMVSAKETELAVDDCDPCADQITVTQTVPNALFRLEVVAAKRGEDGLATDLALAWSLENAEVMVPVDPDLATGIKREPAAYQFLSRATECHQGWLPPGSLVASVFSDTPTITPDPPAGPAFTHIRRWDGWAQMARTATKPAKSFGTGAVTGSNGVLTLAHELFTLTLDLNAGDVLVGDYWLVELRRYAPESGRLRINHAAEDTPTPPIGIEHRFCPLFVLEKEEDATPGDMRRAASFPPLTDLPATHVRYDPAEKCKLLSETGTVQEALDRLCLIEASDVAFDGSQSCETLSKSTNVAEALEALCAADDNTALRLMLRTMMDWGVVCGVEVTLPKARSSQIRIGAGVVLDREGRLAEIEARDIDLRKLDERHILGEISDNRLDAEICVAIALTDDGYDVYLADEETAFQPSDRTQQQRIAACLEGRKSLVGSEVLKGLAAEEASVLAKVRLGASNRNTVKNRMAMSESEARTAEALLNKLTDEFAAETAPRKSEELRTVYAEIDSQANVGGLSGQARDIRRMSAVVDKYTILAKSEEENEQECTCLNRHVPCPEFPKDIPPLIPIACIVPSQLGPGEITISRLCDACCRKQANTPRSTRYYLGDRIAERLLQLEKICCTPRVIDPDRPELDWNGKLDDIIVVREPPVVSPPTEALWPPIVTKKPDLMRDPSIYEAVAADIRQPPAKADIVDLPERAAVDELTGRGFRVADVIDAADEPDLMAKLGELAGSSEEAARLSGRTPQPGDKVVLIKDGVGAVDYVTIEAGRGATPYLGVSAQEEIIRDLVAKSGSASGAAPQARTPPTEAARSDDRLRAIEMRLDEFARSAGKVDTLEERLGELSDDARLSNLEERVSAAESAAERIDAIESRVESAAAGDGLGAGEARVKLLEERLAAVSAETEKIDRLEAQIAERGTDDALVGRINRLESQVGERPAADANRIAELEATVEKLNSAVVSLQPIDAVVGRAEADRLKASGITTLGMLNETDDAQLRVALGSTRSVTSVRTSARSFKPRL